AEAVREAPAPPTLPAHRVGPHHDDPLTAYRKANIYPPTSRPLSKDQLDLLQPNKRHEAMRPTDRDPNVRFLFTADRYFLVGDDTLTATLAVERDGKPLAVTLTQAYASVVDPKTHQEPRVDVAYAPGAAPGAPLSTVFVPSKLPLKRQAAITMLVEFDYGTGKQVAHFDFQYTPSGGVPARFTGTFSDALDNGSLVIHAGVDVISPGHYVIDANLFDADDQPVAWTSFQGELAAGRQDAALLFFGKVIVDGNARGPFHIGQLRGAHYAPGMDPDLEQMPPYPGSFTTQAYTTAQFSDAEYDSPAKRKMIELLSSSTHSDGAGHGMPGGESGGETRQPVDDAR
ncbi:MAG TPA: hypothetical protein VFP84_13900, partial [Kofleriaceae bacterium]|nr:hypothetical protein [Kofleriaceae bacterium]